MTPPSHGTTARVVKMLLRQEAGARKWAAEFGDRLVCVRYRADPLSQRRQTTVERVVEEAPTLASVRVGVRIAWAETNLRQRVKAAGGKWDATAALWMLPLDAARQFGLLDRIVKAIIAQDAVIERIAESNVVAPVHGLSQAEVLALAIIAGEAWLPDSAAQVTTIKRSAERAGMTNMGLNLAVRRLLNKKFLREQEIWNEHEGEGYPGLAVADQGWDWITENESQFTLFRPEKKKDDSPF